MMEKQKIKILNTKYDAQNNIVAWYVEFLDLDKKMTLVWSGDDLGTALGITKKIPPELLDDFCKKMIGKTINIVISAEEQSNMDFKNMSTDEIDKLGDELTKGFEKCLPLLDEGEK